MPTYNYFCEPCREKFSISVPTSNKPPDFSVYCPKCHRNGQVKRIWDKFSFTLKGKGFYSNDSKEKSSQHS